MSIQTENEPEHPQSDAEVQAYCDRLIASLLHHVAERLVCVLLCGSWARGEAKPPGSDTDVTVVLDRVDNAVLGLLRVAWSESNMGLVNIYGTDEIQSMVHDGFEFYTTNARVLWGINPFPYPEREDFAHDVARVAESLLRYARGILIYPWASEEEIGEDLMYAFGKYELLWGLRCIAAYRTGAFPRDLNEVRRALAGTPEERLLQWQETLSDADRVHRSREIALYLNEIVGGWMKEINASSA